MTMDKVKDGYIDISRKDLMIFKYPGLSKSLSYKSEGCRKQRNAGIVYILSDS